MTAYSGTTSKETELIQAAEGTVGDADCGVAPDCQVKRFVVQCNTKNYSK